MRAPYLVELSFTWDLFFDSLSDVWISRAINHLSQGLSKFAPWTSIPWEHVRNADY